MKLKGDEGSCKLGNESTKETQITRALRCIRRYKYICRSLGFDGSLGRLTLSTRDAMGHHWISLPTHPKKLKIVIWLPQTHCSNRGGIQVKCFRLLADLSCRGGIENQQPSVRALLSCAPPTAAAAELRQSSASEQETDPRGMVKKACVCPGYCMAFKSDKPFSEAYGILGALSRFDLRPRSKNLPGGCPSRLRAPDAGRMSVQVLQAFCYIASQQLCFLTQN